MRAWCVAGLGGSSEGRHGDAAALCLPHLCLASLQSHEAKTEDLRAGGPLSRRQRAGSCVHHTASRKSLGFGAAWRMEDAKTLDWLGRVSSRGLLLQRGCCTGWQRRVRDRDIEGGTSTSSSAKLGGRCSQELMVPTYPTAYIPWHPPSSFEAVPLSLERPRLFEAGCIQRREGTTTHLQLCRASCRG
jgi:hypothetical protein